MALLRFSPELDPVSNLLTLQTELERFLRNPAIRLGVSGPGDFPPVNIFDDGDGVVVIAEIPGMDPESLNVSGQSHALTIKGRASARRSARPRDTSRANDRLVGFPASSNQER